MVGPDEVGAAEGAEVAALVGAAVAADEAPADVEGEAAGVDEHAAETTDRTARIVRARDFMKLPPPSG